MINRPDISINVVSAREFKNIMLANHCNDENVEEVKKYCNDFNF